MVNARFSSILKRYFAPETQATLSRRIDDVLHRVYELTEVQLLDQDNVPCTAHVQMLHLLAHTAAERFLIACQRLWCCYCELTPHVFSLLNTVGVFVRKELTKITRKTMICKYSKFLFDVVANFGARACFPKLPSRIDLVNASSSRRLTQFTVPITSAQLFTNALMRKC